MQSIFNPLQTQVGPQNLPDGNFGLIRGGAQGEMVTTHLHGKFYEQARRGNVYIAYSVVAGVTPQILR